MFGKEFLSMPKKSGPTLLPPRRSFSLNVNIFPSIINCKNYASLTCKYVCVCFAACEARNDDAQHNYVLYYLNNHPNSCLTFLLLLGLVTRYWCGFNGFCRFADKFHRNAHSIWEICAGNLIHFRPQFALIRDEKKLNYKSSRNKLKWLKWAYT